MNNFNKYKEYIAYLPYGTDKQKEVVSAVLEHGTAKKAGKKLKCSTSNIRNLLHSLKAKALKQGYDSSMGFEDPKTNATSTLIKGGEGDDFALRWVKASMNKDNHLQAVMEAIEGFEPKPLPLINKSPTIKNNNLLTLYTITDFHLGMYSYHGETGEDWDTSIATKVLMNGISDMIDRTPNSKVGVLNIQGDFLHWDGLDAVTPSSGHILDADTRFSRMIDIAMDSLIWAVEMLLKKHDTVEIIICEGNHDMAGSAWLRKFMKKVLSQNKRVTVNDTDFPYYALLHGEIMLGFHHGHKLNNQKLPALFSSESRYRKMWGNALYTYIHVGHYHHTQETKGEFGGAIVERHPTLAARDAYAARGGYVSMRGARAIVYDKLLGEVERVTVLPREN